MVAAKLATTQFKNSLGQWYIIRPDNSEECCGDTLYQFANNNWWSYAVCTGYNLIRYQVDGEEKTIHLSHGLFTSNEMDKYKRDSFLECAEGLPVYLYLHKGRLGRAPEIRLTTNKNEDFPNPCGVVDSQAAALITGKDTLGFIAADGSISVRKCYKNFFAPEQIGKLF